MAQPSAAISRTIPSIDTIISVTTSEAVYYGAALSDTSGGGTIGHLDDGEDFVGFALQDASSGASCQVAAQGLIHLTVTGVDAATDFGAAVYATEGNTFSLTNSGSDTVIGKVTRVVNTSSNIAEVFFQADALRPE